METLKLSDSESRFFGELFTACDVENTGKVSGSKASELFLASQLPTDVLHQITELCGAKRLGHFGRSQFYIALKLIAAAQLGLPLKLETFNSSIDVTLPKFSRPSEPENWAHPVSVHGQHNLIQLQDGFHNQENTNTIPGQLPPPPAKNRSSSTSGQGTQRPHSLFDDVDSKFSQVNYNAISISKSGSPPPIIESTAVRSSGFISPGHNELSPTSLTALSAGEKDWAPYINSNHVQSAIEEHQWHQFEDDRQLLTTEDETSERHSSEDEEDIWTITDEQREYYTNQFRSMQSKLNGQISGAVAKEFFEKSKLPLQELSKIWQLSDVNKDGALSLEEFFTAMHLVVLRRNNIELPDVLPPSLVPQMNRSTFDDAYSSNNKTATSPQRSPTEPISPQTKEDPKILHPVPLRLSPDSHVISSDDVEINKIPSTQDPIPYEPLQDQQRSPNKWSSAGSCSVDSDVKMGPPAAVAIQRPVAKKTSVSGPGSLPPPPVSSHSTTTVEDNNIPFPVSSFSGPMNVCPTLVPFGLKKEPPPPPPPRPKRNHARSSSLDLNRLVTGRSGSLTGQLGAPPALPPRMSPSTTSPKKLVCQKSEPEVGSNNDQADFADFTQFTQEQRVEETSSNEVPLLKAGAFEVYRRPPEASQGSSLTTASGLSHFASSTASKGVEITKTMKSDSANIVNNNTANWPQLTDQLVSPSKASKVHDKKELKTTIRSQRERNILLSRLNCELNQELSEVMEERIALEIQLEHLKPYSK